jgi:oligoribonuclease
MLRKDAAHGQPGIMETSQSTQNLIWIDLEMTGLDTTRDQIIEIATVITDPQLNELAVGPVIAIHQDESVLQDMDEWNTKQHGKSGLIERVRESRYTTRDAELITLNFLQKHVPPNTSPMCGNSICQDRRFLHRLMPELERYFHYRNLDVSTIKELVRRWFGESSVYNKDSQHRALEDIRDSIQELRYYREKFFNG